MTIKLSPSLYPSRGQSAFSPWRLAMITVMQFAENLSDARRLMRFEAVSTGNICSASADRFRL